MLLILDILKLQDIYNTMKTKELKKLHQFHIPVMGSGFTIDTPLKVAKYGISSVISLVDDVLIEQMRKYHCEKHELEYIEITELEDDARAKRITAYLELIDKLVNIQFEALQKSPFEPDSEITKYFELLPDTPIKNDYNEMLATTDSDKKLELQENLRNYIIPGSIDVNIMTKLDRDRYSRGEKLPMESADALSALRGFAKSKFQSSIVFSAGMNRRLYGYLSKFTEFFPDEKGELKKKIILKVSDFRSAMVQSKFLAKKGLWVSEYRIESGLNCGGHAFATDGFLLGVILDEFKQKKDELVEQLHLIYNKALAAINRTPLEKPHLTRLTIQGGIGTAEENRFLMENYNVDGTGWGTPFLLVPEVTNIDDEHLTKLTDATDKDVYLSNSSPLGIPFWNLRTSASEAIRRRRIEADKPGSECPKGFLVSNTEFTKVPICRASRIYQKKKLRQFAQSENINEKSVAFTEMVTDKSCICHDLGGVATLKLGINSKATPSVCCGPNIVNFNKVVSLKEMVGHIYGQISLISNSDRPHLFIKELILYIEYIITEIKRVADGLVERTSKYFIDFKHNLVSGINYYRKIAEKINADQREKFVENLDTLLKKIEEILPESTYSTKVGSVS